MIAAALCGGWLLWTEFSRRGWIPGVARAVDDPVSRIQAVEALVKRGRESVPELVAALGDADPKIRRGALLGLGRIGPEAGDIMPLVRGALTDNDARVRGEAVTAFGRISRDPRLTAELLAPLLADSNENVRESAALILETIGAESIGPVVEIVHSDFPVERGRTLQVLRRVLESTSWTGRLDVARSLLSDGDRDIRLEALRAVSNRKGRSAAPVNAVGELLDDPDPDVRLSALTVIVGWGAGSHEQIRELLKTEAGIETALNAIARRWPEAAELVPEVVAVLDRQEELEIVSSRGSPPGAMQLHPRFRAILAALSSLKTAARPAASLLVDRLGELRSGNRVAVMATLVDIGAPADELIPLLTPLLIEGESDQAIASRNGRWDETIRQAGVVLRRASPEEGRRQAALLIPRLKGANGKVDMKVLYALWGLGPVAAEAVPELLSLVPNPEGEVFWHAVVTLGEIGPRAEPAVPAFVAALEAGSHDTDGEICQRIIEALGKIGPAAKSAVPLLLRIIDEPERFVLPDAHSNVQWAPMFRRMAISSVGEIDDGSPEVLIALRSLVASAPADVRMVATRALALIAERAARKAISPIDRDSE
jgi:HEAT repeat protein